MICLMVLVWFGVACWLLVNDQSKGRLTDVDDLLFWALKIAALSTICGVGVLLTWVFADREKAE